MSDAKSAQASRRTRSPARARRGQRRDQSSAQFFRLTHLRKLRECEQVAAVCYRMRRGEIEFLLVRTRGSGRWTFPKGNAERGMTHAQAAALEAFEEAGVHGRMEEASFARYTSRKRGLASATRTAEKELTVHAHLCEVVRLGNPKESNRKRTWFSVEDARQHLREGRKGHEGAAFARVVDRAVERIESSRGTPIADTQLQQDFLRRETPQRETPQQDALNKVQFEAPAQALSMPYLRRQVGEMRRSSVPFADLPPREALECEVLQFAPPQESNRAEWLAGRKKPKSLGTGARG
jgi:8-oxo-dGTP pyrophosphatase MutT (NUDIX family)